MLHILTINQSIPILWEEQWSETDRFLQSPSKICWCNGTEVKLQKERCMSYRSGLYKTSKHYASCSSRVRKDSDITHLLGSLFVRFLKLHVRVLGLKR